MAAKIIHKITLRTFSTSKKRKKKKRIGRHFWMRPLFADRATSSAYQRTKKFLVYSHVTELIWPFIGTYKAYDYEKECT